MALGLLLGIAILCGIHLFASRVKALQSVPRNGWLSFAGGASVAYVFLHLLPELEAGHRQLLDTGHRLVSWTEYPTYIIALLGLTGFYALERLAKRHAPMAAHKDIDEEPEEVRAVFWIHIVSFTVYNLVVGSALYEMHAAGPRNFWLYVVAMGFHIFVTDQGFTRHYRKPYLRFGRWILAGALLIGWGVTLLAHIPHYVLAPLSAFIGGGVILNVMKEELPSEQESKLLPFLSGVFGYGGLVLLLELTHAAGH